MNQLFISDFWTGLTHWNALTWNTMPKPNGQLLCTFIVLLRVSRWSIVVFEWVSNTVSPQFNTYLHFFLTTVFGLVLMARHKENVQVKERHGLFYVYLKFKLRGVLFVVFFLPTMDWPLWSATSNVCFIHNGSWRAPSCRKSTYASQKKWNSLCSRNSLIWT